MRKDRVYRTIILGFIGVFRLLGLRFDVRGVENIPATGPAVLASNHLSYLDFGFVGLAARRRKRLVRFMAKRAVFDNRIAGPPLRHMRHIPVDRTSGAAAYRMAARTLASGELVGIFPEATISRAFTPKPFKLGAATLAVWEQMPLVPVVLWAPQRTFTVDKHYSVRRGKTVMILVGEPIVVPPDADRVEVDLELHRRMNALLEIAWREYPDQPRGDDDTWWVPAVKGGSAPTPAVAAEREAASYARRAERKTAKAAKAAKAARRRRSTGAGG